MILEFPQRIRVSQLQIQFQGGFSSRRGHLEGTGRLWKVGVWEGHPSLTPTPFSAAGSQGSEALSKIVDFYPEDNNSLQISCLGLWGGKVGGWEVVCASESYGPWCMTLSKWVLGLHCFICKMSWWYPVLCESFRGAQNVLGHVAHWSCLRWA